MGFQGMKAVDCFGFGLLMLFLSCLWLFGTVTLNMLNVDFKLAVCIASFTSDGWRFLWLVVGMGQNLVLLVNIKIAGKWMNKPKKMVCIGILIHSLVSAVPCL